jgi:fido (protein-threonine AMPylation protein)
MSNDNDDRRHSKPVKTPEHRELTDEERAPIEAENAFRQFDRLMEIVEDSLNEIRNGGNPVPVKTSVLMELNRLAVEKIIANPGGYRQTPMEIGRSKHQPPRWEDVPKYVDEMCEYVQRNWHRSALHLAAYLLWRVNWIHPFSDGNGRTARAISYLVLCIRLRQRLPGDRTMPDFIADEMTPYYAGLEAADAADARGRVDVSILERYLKKLLAQQVENAASAAMQPAKPPPPATQLKRDADAISDALRPDDTKTDGNVRAAYIAGAFVIVGALITGAFALSKCGKDARCTPGGQQTCSCGPGQTGYQTCNDDGDRFGTCDCAGATGSAAAGSTATGSSAAGSTATGSAATGSAAIGSAASGSAAVGSNSSPPAP